MPFYYQSQGEGAPLVILHGLFGSMGNWRSIASKLSSDFKVITLDLPNHGYSPAQDFFNYQTLAQDIAYFLIENNFSPAILLGHSFGGKIAMQCALDFPNQVSGLIVVDIAPRAYNPSHNFIFDALISLDLSYYGSRSEIDKALSLKIPDMKVRQFLLMNLEKTKESYSWRINLVNLRNNYQAICAPITGNYPYKGKNLFIKGENSSYIAADDEQEIYCWFPYGSIYSIPNTDHWVHADSPKLFLEAILAFLK
ncbi:alpha/beta fold hydrolase [Candidatus Nitrosacidococcus tergens]|uniref:Alpha/beta hydrolase fold hydrolase or acyltransferase n=1 Tax=Candidatus Nitrosacidococcus tergens TaxID=553981 RepID=A0A7G1Q920_9GAMM|nr:alpha/beta fold hydrolase [Candidatus Nitrosacidococcus tergens]CAB1275423.1 Alpha/beta hydrolase fold hydrolase or acyltransferase [Candidatus Nitrosacidococcus tergens]